MVGRTSRGPRLRRAASAALVAAGLAAATGAAQGQSVASWESAIANIQRPSVTGRTVRQFARISVGGGQFRVRISNETGTSPLRILDAHVGLAGAAPGSVLAGTDRVLTFNGGAAIVVAPGAGILSDAVDLPVQPLSRLAVSTYVETASARQVGHLLASETNYVAAGDRAGEATMAGAVASAAGFYLAGISVVVGNRPAGVVACLGDSITDGLFSTSDAERRYPDRLAERLLQASQGQVGTINAGIVGNGLLSGDPFAVGGPSALARLSRDILSRVGVHWLIVFEGINDIIYPPDEGDTAAELIAAYGQVIAQAHEHGIKVYGATLTPFAGAGPSYFSPAKEAVRQAVNAWIRGSGSYDAVFDFDAVVRSPVAPAHMLPLYDGGDHLHLSDAGYAAVADAIPLATILRGTGM